MIVLSLLSAIISLHGFAQDAPITVGFWQMQFAAKVTRPAVEISGRDYRPADWYKAPVPGTVSSPLVDNKAHPDPLYGETMCATPVREFCPPSLLITTSLLHSKITGDYERIVVTRLVWRHRLLLDGYNIRVRVLDGPIDIGLNKNAEPEHWPASDIVPDRHREGE